MDALGKILTGAQDMKIPISALSQDTLNGVLDEFISRESNILDGTIQEKRKQVLDAIGRGDAVITYNEQSKTTNVIHIVEYKQMKQQSAR